MTHRRLLTAACACAACLLAPANALAHAGPARPVATRFVAEITSKPSRLEVRVVDGDQALWLRVPPALTVVVLGLSGEPYLRFDDEGVWLNEASPTAYLNRPQAIAVPITAGARRTPRWRHVSDAHSFRWHEDRLHALALTARHPRDPLIGPWTIPLRIDGRDARIEGTLWYRRPPTRLWFWPVAVTVICAAALLRLRRPRVDRALANGFAATGLAAVVLAQLARDLYGRPGVGVAELVELAAACAFVLVAGALYTRPRWRPPVLLAAATASLATGFTLLPTLLDGNVLASLPAPADRLTATLALAAAAGGLLTLCIGTIVRRSSNRSVAAGARQDFSRA